MNKQRNEDKEIKDNIKPYIVGVKKSKLVLSVIIFMLFMAFYCISNLCIDKNGDSWNYIALFCQLRVIFLVITLVIGISIVTCILLGLKIQNSIKRSLSDDSIFRLKIEQKFKIVIYAIAILLLGILLLFINYSIKKQCVINNLFYVEIVDPILYNLAIVLIVLAVGTLCLELFSYIDYSKKRISEVMTEDGFIHLLNDDYKKQLLANTLQSLYSPNDNVADFYMKSLSQDILSLFIGYFYSEYTTSLYCSIENINNGKYIKKEIKRHAVCVPVSKSNESSIYKGLLHITFKKGYPESVEPLQIVSLEVNRKLLTSPKDYIVNKLESHDEQFPDEYSLDLKKEYKFKDECIVDIHYITLVPITDYTYTVKTDRPCQQMCTHFLYDDKMLAVTAHGFTFMAYKDNRNRIEKRDQHVDKMIRVNNWILPGEGVIYSVREKNATSDIE